MDLLCQVQTKSSYIFNVSSLMNVCKIMWTLPNQVSTCNKQEVTPKHEPHSCIEGSY